MKERSEVTEKQQKRKDSRRLTHKPKVSKSWLREGLEEVRAEVESWPEWLKGPKLKKFNEKRK